MRTIHYIWISAATNIKKLVTLVFDAFGPEAVVAAVFKKWYKNSPNVTVIQTNDSKETAEWNIKQGADIILKDDKGNINTVDVKFSMKYYDKGSICIPKTTEFRKNHFYSTITYIKNVGLCVAVISHNIAIQKGIPHMTKDGMGFFAVDMKKSDGTAQDYINIYPINKPVEDYFNKVLSIYNKLPDQSEKEKFKPADNINLWNDIVSKVELVTAPILDEYNVDLNIRLY